MQEQPRAEEEYAKGAGQKQQDQEEEAKLQEEV